MSKRDVQCGRKHQHTTKDEATAHLHALQRAGAWIRNMAAYRCRYCKAWHVGHKPRGKR